MKVGDFITAKAYEAYIQKGQKYRVIELEPLCITFFDSDMRASMVFKSKAYWKDVPIEKDYVVFSEEAKRVFGEEDDYRRL